MKITLFAVCGLCFAPLSFTPANADVPVTRVIPSPIAPPPLVAPLPLAPTTETATVNTAVGGLLKQEELDAIVWVQSSVEAKVAARQAYFLAERQIDAALKDRKWSAAIEQTPSFGKLPPAIILDLDETVLDNSPYQARLVRDNASYSPQTWESWVAQADAGALPGAAAFLKYAAYKGVQIFYVSNRDVTDENATRQNLVRLGLPVQGPADHILLIGEKPEWTSDKTSRRAFIAQNYRVLLLIGDDLNDFVPAKPITLQQRLDLYQKYTSYWGERWILLSNPLYGSWESALFDYKRDLSPLEMLQRKYDSLRTDEPTIALPTAAVASATR